MDETGARWPNGLSGLCFGGGYHPEQWPESVWREDIALMGQAGVNLVAVGAQSWSRLEPAEGEYDFDWLDQSLDMLHDNNIKVVLATPTASPPPWFSLRHPDALTVDPHGNRLSHGSRHTYCVATPAYRAASLRITREIASRYRHHPALSMWHIHGVYGTACHCDHVSRAFQGWLRDRHAGLPALNSAWDTAQWSQNYSDWAQIQSPRATVDSPNPGQLLDFRRFLSDEMLAHFTEQKTLLRQYSPDVPATTTFDFGQDVPVDHWRWAKEVDLVAVNSFPDRTDRGAEEQTAFTADLARSLAGGQPWLLMSQATNVFHTPDGLRTKERGRMERHSMSHVARGSRGVMFDRWRAPLGGAEAWRSAMLPHAGPKSRVFQEICQLGAMLPGLAELDGAPIHAEVGIVWDEQSWWAMRFANLPAPDADYLAAARQAHRVLWQHDVITDFAHPDSNLSRYRLVIVPQLYLTSPTAADNIATYVRDGGALLMTYLSGTAGETGRIIPGGYPGAFGDLLGVRAEEIHPLCQGETVQLSNGTTGRQWSEHLRLSGAEALCSYRGGALDRLPAITKHRHGRGTAWYLSTQLDDADYTELLGTTGILPKTCDPDLETIQRDTDDDSYRIVINHGSKPTEIDATGTDLVTGRPAAGEYQVPPADPA